MPTFQKPIEGGQVLLVASIEDGALGRPYNALLDTGAQRTMVSPKVVDEVSLKAIGYIDIVGVSGDAMRTPKYLVDLRIPSKQGNLTLQVGQELEVAQMPFQPGNFDILLGMDFLMTFHITMYNGLFILSI